MKAYNTDQADLDVTFEDAHFTALDSEYFDLDQCSVVIEPNEEGVNAAYVQITLIKLVDEAATVSLLYSILFCHCYVYVRLYGFQGRFFIRGLSMGRYMKSTGIDWHMTICEMLREPIVMGPFFAVLGFNNTSCPPPPVSNFSLTERKTSYICVKSNTNVFVYSIGCLSSGWIHTTE